MDTRAAVAPEEEEEQQTFLHPPGLVPRPFRRVDSQRRLAEAGVGKVPGDPEGQRVAWAGGHGGGDLGLHGDQGAPGRDGGDVALL